VAGPFSIKIFSTTKVTIMKTFKIFYLFLFAFLIGGAFAIATNTPAAFFAGPALVGANQACIYFSGWSITNILGINLMNIDKNLTNGNNMGGTMELFRFGYQADVETWPTFVLTDLESVVTAIGSLIFKAGKSMYRFYGTQDSCKLTYELVGEPDCKSLVAKLEVFHPGMQKKILGLIATAKNENFFFLAKDREGQQNLLGSADLPVKLDSGNITTGDATATKKGASLVFIWPCNAPQIYTGAVGSGSGS
jgi:hypothetical protein